MRSELFNIDCLEYMKTLPDERYRTLQGWSGKAETITSNQHGQF